MGISPSTTLPRDGVSANFIEAPSRDDGPMLFGSSCKSAIIVSLWNRGNLKYLAFLEGNILSSLLTFCSRKDGVPLIQYGSHIVGRQQTGPLQFYSDVG